MVQGKLHCRLMFLPHYVEYLICFNAYSTVSTSFEDLYMIGLAYLVTGGAFVLAAIMGISLKLYTVLNKRQKKCKQGLVVVFIVTIIVTVS